MLNGIVKRLGRLLKGARGYTLIEVGTVVAITATLAAIAIPVAVDKIREGKVTRAEGEVRALATAIGNFRKDTGLWPAYEGTGEAVENQNFFTVLATDSANYPAGVSGVGALTGWDLDAATTASKVDDPNNHLFVDNPGGNSGAYATFSAWNGPYMEKLGADPWGRSYMVNVKGFHSSTGGYGWVISAGPDRVLETDTDDTEPQGDDVGVMLYKKP